MLPFIKVFGRTVPMYGLCIATGLLVAALYVCLDCKYKKLSFTEAMVIGFTGVLLGFTGAKILFIAVTYTPRQVIEIIRRGQLNALLNSGFVFYGGFIFGVIGALLGAKIAGCKIKNYESTLVKTIPLVHAFGRIGCFCAGCCYGKPANGPLHVVYTNPVTDAPTGIPLIPVQLYESALNFILFFVLLTIDIRHPKQRIILPLYLMAYSVMRFILEYFRYDYMRGFLFGLSTSQWISILIFLAGIFILLIRLRNSDKIKQP